MSGRKRGKGTEDSSDRPYKRQKGESSRSPQKKEKKKGIEEFRSVLLQHCALDSVACSRIKGSNHFSVYHAVESNLKGSLVLPLLFCTLGADFDTLVKEAITQKLPADKFGL